MKELFTEKPKKTWLEVLNQRPGAECILHFCEDIKEVMLIHGEEKQVAYEAEVYTLSTIYRENLLETVEKEREVWLSAAKEKEYEEKSKSLSERVGALESMTEDLALAILGI